MSSAILSAIADQLGDALSRLRVSLPARRWMYPEGYDRRGFSPDVPEGAPTVHHESLQDIKKPGSNSYGEIGVEWWPELDELCVLLRRIQQYERSQ